ncbi:carbohydrate sulfotransferase 15-like [Anneissia japonica]|uniref:carbohydrate sulfotransferase 15-like n=1 Tax=Anneissia japonica TaxID=1529436 RepID=UPI001425AA58|nr:carbohydrate sulfotransferase 15-like [Anneissia japonica]
MEMNRIILQSVPQVFNSDFKSPCWYENKVLLRCLPYFYVAGMPKSGTTDLLSKINSHPDIVPVSKEIQWWTRRRYHGKSFSWYLNEQTSLVMKVTTGGSILASRLISGDGSASTLWDNHVLDDVDGGPEYTHSDVIRTVQPDARIIGIFRNPTDRLYSDYKFFHRNQTKSPEIFHLLVEKSIKSFNYCLQHLDVRKCTYIYHDDLVRLDIGNYNIYVRDWLRAFPRQQLYFLRTDEWRNCTIELPKIYNFLAQRPLSDSEITSICTKPQRNTNTRRTNLLGPMLPETRKLLDDFYKPFMKDLAEALEDKRYIWD